MLNTIFIKSEPISAIFVNIPPAILRTEAPRDSPIAKPIKQAPAKSEGINKRITSIIKSSMLIRSIPMLIPARRGIAYKGYGFPFRLAKAVLEFAKVLILIPNHATV